MRYCLDGSYDDADDSVAGYPTLLSIDGALRLSTLRGLPDLIDTVVVPAELPAPTDCADLASDDLLMSLLVEPISTIFWPLLPGMFADGAILV